MRGQLIVYALSMFIGLSIQNGYLKGFCILWLFVLSFWLPKINQKQYFVFLVFLLLFKPVVQSGDYEVIERSNKNAIVSIAKEKVVVFTNELLFKQDCIQLVGTVKEATSLDNFVGFNYAEYLRKMNIVGCLKAEDVSVIKNKSVERVLYEWMKSRFTHSQMEVVESLLYGVNQEYHGSFFLISTGLHLSGLNTLLLSLFAKLGKKKGLASNLVLSVLSYLFDYRTAFFRLFFRNSLDLFKLSKKDKLALNMMLVMLVRPISVFELSFLVPFGFQFIHLFNVDKEKSGLLSFVFSCLIQCSMNYQCNLIEVGLLSFYRKLNIVLYLICLITVFIPGIQFCLDGINFVLSLARLIPSLFVLSGLGVFGVVGVGLMLYAMSCRKRCVAYFVVFFLCWHFKAYLNPFYEVTFLNVGQGDSILIQAPFNTSNVLIDVPGGLYNQSVEKVIVPTLRYKGISLLDTVILTHQDLDHSGGYEDLIQAVLVEEVVLNPIDVNHEYLHLFSLNQSVYGNDNDNSLVYASHIGGLWYLFMGDVSKRVERDILRNYPMLECDVLKLGHHGSKTSSDAFFIKALMPQIAIASAKANNIYGHPSYETLDVLDSVEVRVFVTADSGAVSIKSFLNFNFITSATKEFGIMIAE